MRRWTSSAAFFVALICATVSAASGQATGPTGTIAGQVVSAEGKTPLQGAQITVLGTPLRATANAEGRYTVRNVSAGTHAIRVQMLGYAPSEQTVAVTAGGTATLPTIEMKDLPYAIAPVITTALGIAREEKSLGYATTSIPSATLEKIPEVTMMQALAGQSAGVAVTSGSGRPGAGARPVIRGEASFSGSGQPLFVIDGVPVSTSSDSRSDPLGTGSSGSRQMDFDMENIDELTVLKGAAATALYGARAANGAIIIRTKSGKQGQPLQFNFNTQLRYDQPIIGGYITDWAAGSRGYYCNGKNVNQGGWCEPGSSSAANPQSTNNWGPHKDSIPKIVFDSVGEVRFRDPRADFYQTAPTTDNSLRGAGSMGDLGTYTLGGSYLNQEGVNPAEKLNRLNLNGNVNIRLTKWLQSTTSIQRTRSNNPYQDDSFSGIDKTLIDMPATFDMREGYLPDGTPRFLTSGLQPSLQWQIANQFNKELTNRWIASQVFSFLVGSGIHLNNNAGLDTYVSEFGRFLNQRPWIAAQGQTSGSTQQRKSTRTTINDDLTLVADPRPLMNTSLRISGLLGGNLYSQDAASITGNGTSIVIPDYFNLGNFATQTVSGNLTTQRRLLGAYSQVEMDYKDWAFFTVTGRNDWSSTLPTNANSYFYPSAQLALIFTDAISWRPNWLDYGKLRLSKAKVGNDAPQYALTTRYVNASASGANNSQQQNGGPSLAFPFRGVTSYISSTSLGNPTLKPETTVEDEIGLELRMFKGRFNGEVSVYRKSSYDQIFSVPSSPSSGFTSISRNAGNLRNNGIELSIGGRPIETRLFSWDGRINWARNRSTVLSLAPGVTSIYLAGYSWPQIRIMDGQPYGVIWGYGWKKNCVAADPCFKDQGVPEGTLLIGDDGYPIRSDDQRNLGTVQPDWTGSATSQFRVGRFSLSGLLDIRHGGQLINFETQYEVNNGRSLLTADRYTWTTWNGVNINTGKPNTVRLFKDQDYYPLVYGFDRHEMQIENAGFAKLREVTLSYRLTDRVSQRLNLRGATAYLTGRNLRGWYSSPSGDPEGDLSQGTNAGQQYFRQFSAPQTRSFLFGIRSIF